MTNERQELVDMLREAQDKLGEVFDLLEYVISETDNEAARGYVLNNLKATAGGHGFFGSYTLESWIEELENQES